MVRMTIPVFIAIVLAVIAISVGLSTFINIKLLAPRTVVISESNGQVIDPKNFSETEVAACEAILKRYCEDTDKKTCWMENLQFLPAKCREFAKDKTRHSIEGCAQDVDKFCADVEVGAGRLIKCLKDKESKLSNSCKAKMAKIVLPGTTPPPPPPQIPRLKENKK